MTEQPVETEQEFLGNAGPVFRRGVLREWAKGDGALPAAPLQHYAPGAHLLFGAGRYASAAFLDHEQAIANELAAASIDLPAAAPAFIAKTKQADLWLDAEEQATRALAEIQDGNINAGVACLQAALAFALNYRHSLTEETAR